MFKMLFNLIYTVVNTEKNDLGFTVLTQLISKFLQIITKKWQVTRVNVVN